MCANDSGPLFLILLAIGVGGTAAAQPYSSPAEDPELIAVMSHVRQRSFDRIPAIDEPTFVDSAEARIFLTGADQVVGIEHQGVIKVYPIKFLNGHELVNDRLGKDPVAVAWCPIVERSIIYQATIRPDILRERANRIDSVLTFGITGILRNSALVMYDRSTISLWTLEGVAISGPLRGLRLRSYPSERTSWRSWLDRHPETVVMGPPAPAVRRQADH